MSYRRRNLGECSPDGLGMSVVSGTSTGASAGAAAGPHGAAIGAAVGAVSSALSALFGGGDPKPQERARVANELYQAALGGNLVAEAQLRCLSGAGNQADHDLLIQHPETGYGSGCVGGGWATTVARAYGRAKLLELKARRAAGTVGGFLVGQSDIPATIGGTFQRAATNPLVLGGVVLLGAYLVLRKRR